MKLKCPPYSVPIHCLSACGWCVIHNQVTFYDQVFYRCTIIDCSCKEGNDNLVRHHFSLFCMIVVDLVCIKSLHAVINFEHWNTLICCLKRIILEKIYIIFLFWPSVINAAHSRKTSKPLIMWEVSNNLDKPMQRI
jgi:hypothetical protein